MRKPEYLEKQNPLAESHCLTLSFKLVQYLIYITNNIDIYLYNLYRINLERTDKLKIWSIETYAGE